MRSLLALCILMALCVSAEAAARRHQAQQRQIIVRPGQSAPVTTTPDGAHIYRDNSAPGGFRTDRDPVPAYDDPSKFSGG